MKEKLLCLGTEESIIIFNEHCSEAIRISNHNNEIITSKIKNEAIIENIKIFPVKYSDLDHYFIFKNYYQQMAGLGVNKEIKHKLEELMDYHLKFINIPKNNNNDIENILYQVTVLFKNECDENHKYKDF